LRVLYRSISHPRRLCFHPASAQQSWVPSIGPLAANASLFQLGDGVASGPDELGYYAPKSNGFSTVETMPKSVLVANRRAASACTTVHSTSALPPHCRRSAWLPGAGPGSALERPVHTKLFVVHGLVPPISRYAHPRIRRRRQWPPMPEAPDPGSGRSCSPTTIPMVGYFRGR